MKSTLPFRISWQIGERETPTAAAEMAVPDTNELRSRDAEIHKNNLEAQMNNKIKLDRLTADNFLLEMRNSLHRIVTSAEHKLEKFGLMLEENNPENILGKGYSFMQTRDGEVITSVSAVKTGEEYKITLKDGNVIIKAMEINAR